MSKGFLRSQKTCIYLFDIYLFNILGHSFSQSAGDKGSANGEGMTRYHNGSHIREAHTSQKSQAADLSAQLNGCAIYF